MHSGKYLLPCILGLSILTSSVRADDFVTREHSFELNDIEEIQFNSNVGAMEIRLVEGNELKIRLEIEGDDGGWFRRDREVDDVDIEVSERNGRLMLRLDEKRIRSEWFIEMPVVNYTGINLGVGEIDAQIGATNLDINLGVGDVNVEGFRATAGRINLKAGVGDAGVHGAEIISSRRAFVSQDIDAMGNGDKYIIVNIGVGDIDINLD